MKVNECHKTSIIFETHVADQGCLSRIRILIQDPGSNTKKRRKINYKFPQLESGRKLYKIKNYLVLRTGIEKDFSECDPKTCH
jgi:hypothetical protein